MPKAFLEHVNVTVSDPVKTAERLCRLFDWRIRWQGEAISGGYTVHVGSDDSYIAVYSRQSAMNAAGNSYTVKGGLNHIGIVVDDLDKIETKVIEAGYHPHAHADYEPGRRFYFDDEDEIEFEVVSYQAEAKREAC